MALIGLGVSGVADFHADEAYGPPSPGSVSLPRERFDDLQRRHERRIGASGR
jgi:hypothetical protein